MNNEDLMPKFYTLEDMTQDDLNKLALERNSYAKEIDRLSNAFDELEKYLIEGTKEPHYVAGDMFFSETCEIILMKLNKLRSK